MKKHTSVIVFLLIFSFLFFNGCKNKPSIFKKKKQEEKIVFTKNNFLLLKTKNKEFYSSLKEAFELFNKSNYYDSLSYVLQAVSSAKTLKQTLVAKIDEGLCWEKLNNEKNSVIAYSQAANLIQNSNLNYPQIISFLEKKLNRTIGTKNKTPINTTKKPQQSENLENLYPKLNVYLANNDLEEALNWLFSQNYLDEPLKNILYWLYFKIKGQVLNEESTFNTYLVSDPIEALKFAINTSPDIFKWWWRLQLALTQFEKDPQTSLALIDEQWPVQFYYKALLLFRVGKRHEALKVLERLKNKWPNSKFTAKISDFMIEDDSQKMAKIWKDIEEKDIQSAADLLESIKPENKRANWSLAKAIIDFYNEDENAPYYLINTLIIVKDTMGEKDFLEKTKYWIEKLSTDEIVENSSIAANNLSLFNRIYKIFASNEINLENKQLLHDALVFFEQHNFLNSALKLMRKFKINDYWIKAKIFFKLKKYRKTIVYLRKANIDKFSDNYLDYLKLMYKSLLKVKSKKALSYMKEAANLNDTEALKDLFEYWKKQNNKQEMIATLKKLIPLLDNEKEKFYYQNLLADLEDEDFVMF